jgi:shikimate dehydrogenase
MAEVAGAADAGSLVVGVIGSPIAQSLSPTLHRAAFEALGLAGMSVAFEVPAGQAAAALEAMRASGLRGLSVTMPLKSEVAGLVDTASVAAGRLDAVNCVVNEGGVLHGTNTDGEGFVAALARGAGFAVAGRRCLVAGAGGAARAVVVALAEAGASEVAVLNRTAVRAAEAAALAGGAGRVVSAGDAGEVAARADLVVNATSVGMVSQPGGDDDWPVSPRWLHSGQVVADLIYVPRPTRWLAAAAETGATTVDGLGMLVHQAAAQITLWTGQPAPVDAMWRSVGGGRS